MEGLYTVSDVGSKDDWIFPLSPFIISGMIDTSNSIPEKKYKRPAWSRHLDVVLRTAHVGVTSVVFGGAVFAIPFHLLQPWYYLTFGTGCALIASEYYHSHHWPYQGRGAMVVVHAGLLGLIHFHPEWSVPVLTVALVFGMVGSHMPKRWRYWSFIHRRVVDWP